MSSDPFRHDDVAYVLGALDGPERLAFETHLADCPQCRARVAEARSAAGLLAGLGPGDAADAGPVPDTLLPALLRRAGRERARRRVLTGGLGVLAAACLLALVVVGWPFAGPGPAGPAQRALTPVRPGPVTASAALVSRAWGTEIDLRCHYVGGGAGSGSGYAPYDLVVVDRSGGRHDAGSWTLVPDEEVTFTGGTSLPSADIAEVQITLADGTPILALRA